jgi:hypothetical protein
MIETPQALARIHKIVAIPGIHEVFIGLNDLHIGFGLTFMFELLSGGIVDHAARILNQTGMPFGFGGIAKIGEGLLPAEYIIGEHYRLGSFSVILSRTFRNDPAVTSNHPVGGVDLAREVTRIRDREAEVSHWSLDDFERNRQLVCAKTDEIVAKLEE